MLISSQGKIFKHLSNKMRLNFRHVLLMLNVFILFQIFENTEHSFAINGKFLFFFCFFLAKKFLTLKNLFWFDLDLVMGNAEGRIDEIFDIF